MEVEKSKVALKVQNLQKSFQVDFYKPPVKVLINITFQVPEGKFIGLIGPNGAGKTTTIKCLLDFITLDFGKIDFVDYKNSFEARKDLGYLPERPFFQEFLSAQEFLKLHWSLSGRTGSADQRIEQVLELVGLAEVRYAKLKTFSKGMLQRIGIAQALIAHPRFLILDEPMSGLDPDGRILVKDILRKLKKADLTLIMSSHLLEDVEELCDELIVLQQGQCHYNGPLSEFKKNYPSLEDAYRHFKDKIAGTGDSRV